MSLWNEGIKHYYWWAYDTFIYVAISCHTFVCFCVIFHFYVRDKIKYKYFALRCITNIKGFTTEGVISALSLPYPWTYINEGHNPESVRHPGDEQLISGVVRITGHVRCCCDVTGVAAKQHEIWMNRRWWVGAPAGTERAVAFIQERVDHQWTDKSSHPDEAV